jgi:ATP-dependent exoDNAse (exonuclease V) alpha subunit
MDKESMLASIERAKAIVAAAKQQATQKQQAAELAAKQRLGLQDAPTAPAAPVNSDKQWNTEQQQAIDNAYFRKSFCLIGAAGTGKTTTLKAILSTLIENHRLPPLEASTKHLSSGAPGVALISYTRRAVRNIAKQMDEQLKDHCITFHKLVEYEPFFYEEWNAEEERMVNKMRFEPSRNRVNPLPQNLKLIVVDESSMLSIDYWNQVLAALPNPSQVQFIFLGDLNQLPPVYGQAILGKQLLNLPIIELTKVYRQALESPIIALALAVKDNSFSGVNLDAFKLWGAPIDFDAANVKQKTVLVREGRGKVTLHPWKKTLDKEDALYAMQGQLNLWMKDGSYDPEQDLVLCPWNTSFGTDELNLSIADNLAKSKGAKVHEVIAGFNKYYFAVGDKLLIDKMEAVILDIFPNPRYLGKRPQPASTTLNRWGNGGTHAVANPFEDDLSDEQIDALLEHAAGVDDRTAEASHTLRVRFLDSDNEETISKSATLNNASFAYAITVHKAQGSECRRVFLLLHDCHAAMCSRELIYTAITRAAEELYVVMPPKMLAKAASKPRIKGDTLIAKLEFFNSRLAEKTE